ncbi:MAG: hypothetical protein J0H29_19215 [Sphingobacteriales bacterium]|nr:hypothetical protein [Sphingobacteriales bacterium]
MHMSNASKFNYFIALSFIALWICNYLKPKTPVDEIVINDIHIPRKPCISAINEIFGRGVDSSKICDCLIPKFYDLIKEDTVLIKRFKSEYFFVLNGGLQDSAMVMYADCIKTNMVDSSATFYLTPQYSGMLKEKLKKAVSSRIEFNHVDAEKVSSCIVDRLNGQITIGEYFSEDYLEVPKLKKIMLDCINQSAKEK